LTVDLHERLSAGLEKLKLVLTDEQQDLLLDYLELLHKWNQHFNLTAVRDIEKMLSVHLFDSLSISRFIKGDTLLDVGTGAGLPGIPLAIVYPEKKVTLLDSNGKKIRFCRQAVMELGLENVNPIQMRIEKMDREVHFATIISRAFSDLDHMLKMIGPLMDNKTQLLAMKGQVPEGELENLIRQGFKVNLEKLEVPEVNGLRHLITIRK
jgi:16S rRNA (guanine527-N7)-methyltransferase